MSNAWTAAMLSITKTSALLKGRGAGVCSPSNIFLKYYNDVKCIYSSLSITRMNQIWFIKSRLFTRERILCCLLSRLSGWTKITEQKKIQHKKKSQFCDVLICLWLWNTQVSKKWLHSKVIIICMWNTIVLDMVIKENAGYIKSIRYIKQWQQWIRRNCGSAFEFTSFPQPPSHPWQPVATLWPLSPSLVPPCLEEQAIDMSSVP